MTDIRRFMYAVCATGFFLMAAYGLIEYGDKVTRVLTIVSLVLAGASQFLAQEESPRAQGAAWAFILFGAAMLLLAIIAFMTQMTVTP